MSDEKKKPHGCGREALKERNKTMRLKRPDYEAGMTHIKSTSTRTIVMTATEKRNTEVGVSTPRAAKL